MADVVAAVLLLAGVSLFVLAGIGLHRFDGVFARMHAATKPATLGLLLVLLGTALRVGGTADVMKVALVCAFQLLTAPIGAHMVGRAVYRAGVGLGSQVEIDELAGEELGDDGGVEG